MRPRRRRQQGLRRQRPPLLFVDGARVCEATPLDRLANNKRPRRLKQHTALAQRVLVHAPMVAKTDPALLDAMLTHGLAAAGAPADLLTAEARLLLHRACRGLPRLVSQLLRLALLLADEQELPSIDASVISSAIALAPLGAAP